jgi:hypothetical protein
MRSGVLAIIGVALCAAACSGGGGLSAADRTGTREGISHAATATAVAAALPPVTQKDLVDVIGAGFLNLTIPFTATTNASFRKQDLLLGVLDDCANERGHGFDHADPSYWPSVLGDCYTVGDATKWLWEYTNKHEFAYANQLAMRFMRQKLDDANAAGAGLDDGYWALVVGKIYTLTNEGTPIAATPLAGT